MSHKTTNFRTNGSSEVSDASDLNDSTEFTAVQNPIGSEEYSTPPSNATRPAMGAEVGRAAPKSSKTVSISGVQCEDLGDGWGLQNDGQKGSKSNPTQVLHPEDAIQAAAHAIVTINKQITATIPGGEGLPMLRPIAATIAGVILAQVYDTRNVNPDTVMHYVEEILRRVGKPTEEESRMMSDMQRSPFRSVGAPKSSRNPRSN